MTVAGGGVGAITLVLALTGMGLASADPESAPASGADTAAVRPLADGIGGTGRDGGGNATAGAITASLYEVRPGNNLDQVARLHGVSLAALAAHNELQEPYLLHVGQRLRIPVPAEADPAPVPSSSDAAAVRQALLRWSAEHHLPPDLLAAVLWQESRWRADAESEKGAMGVGQLLAPTASWVAEDLIGETLDPWDVDDNVRMSARLLRWLIDLEGGDQAAALAAYYQGQGSIERSGWFDDTDGYVGDVFAWRWRFRLDPSW